MVAKKSLAVIPARSGSKRIPHKNVIPFFGKPLIAHTILAAKQSGMFDEVVVSTDSQKIADIATEYGATVPFLRDIHFDDLAPVSEAVLRAVEQSEHYFNSSFSTVTQLMPNCPLRTEEHIVQAHKQFTNTKARAQISCFEFGFMNPWWAFTLTKGKPKHLFAEALSKRSQDLEKVYCPTGAVWISNVDVLKKARTFYSKQHTYFVLPWEAAVDIDTYDDLRLATALYQAK